MSYDSSAPSTVRSRCRGRSVEVPTTDGRAGYGDDVIVGAPGQDAISADLLGGGCSTVNAVLP